MKLSLLRNYLFLLIVLGLALTYRRMAAQAPTATAVPVVMPTFTPTMIKQVQTTPTRTPTPVQVGLARVQARSQETGANVRALGTTDSTILGKIFRGQFYAVVGRHDKWLLIQYDKSPTALGWVYEDVVDVTGMDSALIPTVDPTEPPPRAATQAATEGATPQASKSGPLPPSPFPADYVEATLPPHHSATAS